MKSLWSRLATALVVLLLWLTLTSPTNIQEWLTGLALALVMAIVPLPGRAVWGQWSLMPRRLWFSLLYVFVFLWALLKSNLDVAYRVLVPSLPINPGIVLVRTRLKSPLGRLVLANSITLTPGTITVDLKGDELTIHWINRTTGDLDAATAQIVGDFEKYLEVIFD